METQRQDRRIRRTQKMLKESLVELMMEKDFKNISVKDITDRADLNRGTFYLHYTDTYDLLQKMETEVLCDFQDMINGHSYAVRNDSLLPVLSPVIKYIEENAEICKILFENTASNDFMNRFHNLIYKNGTEIIREQYPDAEADAAEYFFEFVIYGLIGVIKQWIDSGMRQPKEKLAELADRAVMGAAKSLLGA